MSDATESAAVIDLTEARRDRLHDIHEARLKEVRTAFEKAFPLPSSSPTKKHRAKKKGKKR
ncbi:MAG: hypothetical protein WC953_13475 [Pseudomonas sp.]